jgi:MGT family glycosyltransferase
MTRIVFFGLPLHGHTNPTLPLVRELVSRGAQVAYYSNESFAEKIKLSGGFFRDYHSKSLSDIANIPEHMERMPYVLMTAVKDVIGEELARVRDEAPDLIIHDSVAPWGKCIAQLLGIPAVSSVTTFAFNSKVVRLGARAKPKSFSAALSKLRHIAKALRVRKEIRKNYGIKGPALLDLYVGREQLNIVYTSTYFQPFAETFDHRYKFVGPIISDRQEQTDLLPEKNADEKLVYVSLGTLFNEDEAFYRNCFQALEHKDFRVIVSTGGRTVEELGAVPSNFIVRSFVPQLEVLRRASAFITRGGMNSVSESLYFGVPVLVIPHMAEQMVIARRVEQLGAGVHVKKADATSRRIGDAVHRLMADEAYRRNSRLVGDSFRIAGGAKRAADEVLGMLAFH